jgi:nudix-type nucleoside diphosphatase (YffH/AdpP family)
MPPEVKIIKTELLSDNWYTLRKITFDLRRGDGQWERQEREAYDRGNGATILLYNKARRTVILTRQFRMPTYLNGNPEGLLIEACAGLLDAEGAAAGIQRETEEETGYRVEAPQKIFEAYMSPGSVTEIVHFFVAPYDEGMKVSEGGGVAAEQEHIEVLEMNFDEACQMIQTGAIRDAKTILLLQYAQLNGLLDE